MRHPVLTGHGIGAGGPGGGDTWWVMRFAPQPPPSPRQACRVAGELRQRGENLMSSAASSGGSLPAVTRPAPVASMRPAGGARAPDRVVAGPTRRGVAHRPGSPETPSLAIT